MAHRIRLSLVCRFKWTRKSQVSYRNVSEQYLLLWNDRKVYCVYTRIVSTKDVQRRTNKKLKPFSEMHKILVHARDSWACTTLLCMHSTLVHAQECCACTRSVVHAQESCACTRILCRHKNLFCVHKRFLVWTQYTFLLLHNNNSCSETFPYQTWDFLVHFDLHSRPRWIQWRIIKFCRTNT